MEMGTAGTSCIGAYNLIDFPAEVWCGAHMLTGHGTTK